MACVAPLTLSVAPRTAEALQLVRLTRNGYVLVDEVDAATPYEGRVPTSNTADTLAFVAEVTRIISEIPEAPRARFIAVMQSRMSFSNALAFYLPIKNTVRGIGQRQGGRETWDLNATAGTAFPLIGFVWLNSWRLYLDAAGQFGNYQVCTQEFGHRWGPQPLLPPMPTGEGVAMDAGISQSDASADSGDAVADGSSPDGSTDATAPAADSGVLPSLSPQVLLGRDRVHWSFFVHSGASPLEGNNWREVSPGVFRTQPPTWRFSSLDLYLMGVLAPEEVEPSFLIAEPDVGSFRDENDRPITASTGPDTGDPGVEVRGRRVNFGVGDIIRANGRRNPPAVTIPATRTPDGSVIGDASLPPEPRENDIDVIWIMLTTRERLQDIEVVDFERAVTSCTEAYAYASSGRSLLFAQRVQNFAPDAGVAPPDARAVGARDGAVPSGDVGAEAVQGYPGGGCACRAVAVDRGRSRGGSTLLLASVAMATLSLRRRGRAKTHLQRRRGAVGV